MCAQITDIKNSLRLADTQLGNSDSSALDAEILLAHVLKKDRSYLRAWPEKKLSETQQQQFCSFVAQREKGKPIAYITGEREFWSQTFLITPDVLIPRPDTELLIDTVLNVFKTSDAIQVADLGTGSGIIAICLGLEYPNSEIVAIDASEAALEVAKNNAKRLKCNNIRFVQSDWLAAITDTQFDLIVSNPPYIDEADEHLKRGDIRFEPLSALVAKKKGLYDFEVIATQTQKKLKNGAHLLLEHGFEQGEMVKNLLKSLGYCNIKQFKDIQGHLRATLCQYIHG